MVQHLGEKIKSHRESQKGTRADAIIQLPPPTTTTLFQDNTSVCENTPVHQDTTVCQETPD